MFPFKYVAIATVTLLAFFAADTSYAQADPNSETSAPGHVNLRTSRTLFAAPPAAVGIRQYPATVDPGSHEHPRQPAATAYQSPAGRRHRSIGRKILGGALGGVGGFFAGGYLGAIIEGDRCQCDDPGLQGALIGAPIGAAVGAILGVKFF